MFFDDEPSAREEWGDPYWSLAEQAPQLVHNIKGVLHMKLGVDPDTDEGYALDAATAGTLSDRLLRSEFPTIEALRTLPPEFGAILGVFDLIRTADFVSPQSYPPQPTLLMHSVPISVRYAVEVKTYLPVGKSELGTLQLHTATRTHNLRNGMADVLSTACLVGIQSNGGGSVALPIASLDKLASTLISSERIEAQGGKPVHDEYN